MFKKIVLKLDQWAVAHPQLKKPVHTAIQAFLGVFIAGITPIIHLVTTHDLADAKVALFALIGAALAAAFSVLKTQLWPIILAKATQ